MEDSGIDIVAVNDRTNAATLRICSSTLDLGNLKADISEGGRTPSTRRVQALDQGPGADAVEDLASSVFESTGSHRRDGRQEF